MCNVTGCEKQKSALIFIYQLSIIHICTIKLFFGLKDALHYRMLDVTFQLRIPGRMGYTYMQGIVLYKAFKEILKFVKVSLN